MKTSKNLFFVLFIVLSSTMHVYSGQNYCLQFDGVDDYVDMPDGFADFRNGFTIEMWAHPTSPRSYARFIDFGNGSPSDNIIFARNATSDTLVFEVYIGDSSRGRLEAGQVIDLNMWQHLAATLDLSGEVIVYKNGVEVAR